MSEGEIKKAFHKFLQQTIIISVVLFAIYFFINNIVQIIHTSPATPWLILFFLALSNFVFYMQLKASAGRPAKFVNATLISTGFKLLLLLVIIVIYALVFREDAVHFILTFFVIYLIFTILEVLHIKSFQEQSGKTRK